MKRGGGGGGAGPNPDPFIYHFFYRIGNPFIYLPKEMVTPFSLTYSTTLFIGSVRDI